MNVMPDRRAILSAAAVLPIAGGAMAGAPRKSTGAFKASEFVRRPSEMSGDWLEAWHERAALLRQLAGVRRVAFNIVDRRRSPDSRWDGVVETSFVDEASYRRAIEGASDPGLHEALADQVKRFCQPDPMTMLVRESVIRPLPAGDPRGYAKRIGLVGRHPATSRADFFKQWAEVHAPEVLGQYGLVGYSLNMSATLALPSSPWDGFAELWWQDWAAFDEAVRRGSNGYARRATFFHGHALLYVTQYD
jgi:hypothetical protein